MARVEKYQETPPDGGVIVHQSAPFPIIMGFPHLSKGLDGFLIGDLDRTAREVAESLAAPVEIDLTMPVDLGLSPPPRHRRVPNHGNDPPELPEAGIS